MFCFKLGKTATETLKMLQKVYGETAVTNKTRFREVNESLEDDERTGQPLTVRNDKNIVEFKTVSEANRRLTIREIAEDIDLSFGSVEAILTYDLKMNISLLTPRTYS